MFMRRIGSVGLAWVWVSFSGDMGDVKGSGLVRGCC